MYTELKYQFINLLMVIVISVSMIFPTNTNSLVYAEDNNEKVSQITETDVIIKDYIDQQLYMQCVGDITTETIEEAVKKREAEIQQKILEQQMLEEQKRQEELRRLKTVESSRNVSYYDISVYTDLSVLNTINADQMNEIIDYWASLAGYSPFIGHGQTFIDAAKETGLDPVYLLAHAGLESAWGNSQIAQDKYNYFGIGAYDSSPYESSYYMGDGVSQGIMEGAIWIADNYYYTGQSSLYTMRYNNGYHEYCTSDTWMYNIADIMYTSYSLIQ